VDGNMMKTRSPRFTPMGAEPIEQVNAAQKRQAHGSYMFWKNCRNGKAGCEKETGLLKH